jgi:uncharacterized protein
VIRVVLDTNVWLDWLVFDDPGVAAIRAAHAAGEIEIWMCGDGEAELGRVLAYQRGRRTLAAGAQTACLARCRALVRRIEGGLPEAERRTLPVCRDRDDQKFLEAALAAGAQVLVTKDKALLELSKRVSAFRIVAPAGFGLTRPRAAPLRT